MSKMMIAYLESFLGVSPFLQTQDPRVDRDTMEKLDEVNNEACIKYVARKILAWYTNFPPKNDGAATDVDASAPPESSSAHPRPPCRVRFLVRL